MNIIKDRKFDKEKKSNLLSAGCGVIMCPALIHQNKQQLSGFTENLSKTVYSVLSHFGVAASKYYNTHQAQLPFL